VAAAETVRLEAEIARDQAASTIQSYFRRSLAKKCLTHLKRQCQADTLKALWAAGGKIYYARDQ
jgi:hypothetical protein